MRALASFAFACLTAAPVLAAAESPTTSGEPQRGPSAFNPAISLILSGTYARFDADPDAYRLPGFALAEETGPGTEGLSLGESELVMSANVDNQYLGYLTAALTPEDELEVEEAYIQTIGLPAGLTLRAGRFFSGIGYLNEQHPHAWDFVDTALPYRAMLGNQYGDDGVQVRWLAPTDLFIELGAEALRGEAFPAGGAAVSGTGTRSVFAHVGGDIGISHSWRMGLSRLYAKAHARATGEESDVDLFTGDSTVNIADIVWKWAPAGNATVTNFKLQGEYLWRDEEGEYLPAGVGSIASAYDAGQTGWYAQAVYQFMPRWRAGLRHDELKADAVPATLAGTVLDAGDHTPRRDSVMIDFSNSEFSRLRVQYNRDRSRPETDNQTFIQYIMSLGAHGAHKF
jgi:hypothetical protein